MADKLRKGKPADMVILTARMIADLAKENLITGASVSDIGLVETAGSQYAPASLASVNDAAGLPAAALLAADAIFVPDPGRPAGIMSQILGQFGHCR